MRPIPLMFAAAALTLPAAGGFAAGTDLPSASPPPPVETVRAALAAGRAEQMGSLLPAAARVDLDLRTVPPARGLHGGRQAQVLLQKRFDACSPAGLESFSSDAASGGTAVEIRAVITCARNEGGGTLKLRGTIESRTDGQAVRWVLKELREMD